MKDSIREVLTLRGLQVPEEDYDILEERWQFVLLLKEQAQVDN